MSVVKVIELLAQSEKGWEDAVDVAVQEASKTVKNIKSVYVKEFQAKVQDNRVRVYRANVKISFEVTR
ncbi:MAG: dodecin family protein [Desulfovibrionales bacterium]